ncbi:hypothetical protein GCM10009802_32890 [Streptomyces synnematoformans]|uniref:Beta-galactosidase n=1 Tax=Streptomyces synnematoformans TaxID=415721 RepID=A0ABP5K8I5_9ACTN
MFQSQWTSEPMVHLLPMDWTAHQEGETVEVWAYTNVDTVELYLNGRSVGVRTFDRKTTVDGRPYLETTEATGDDKAVTGGPWPGSYTSPNGSAGKLHLTWRVPFAPGELRAVARRGGRTVATDVLRTAGPAHAVRLTPDRDAMPADGRSLCFVTAEVVDAHGTVVPDAAHRLAFDVAGGSLAGVDNGRQESAERYQASTWTAFHGKALAVARSGTRPGRLTVTARAGGLRTGTAAVRTDPARDPATTPPARFTPGPEPVPPDRPVADASYSGKPDTLPAMMLDGNPETGWSNAFCTEPTALLPALDGARCSDRVSVRWDRPRGVDRPEASFTVDDRHSLPATVEVAAWDPDRHRYVPVRHAAVEWARMSDAPTLIVFDRLRTTSLRLSMTSRHPGEPKGALRISRLEVPEV